MADQAVRRVYEIDVKLASDAAEALRTMQRSLKELEDNAASTKKSLSGFLGVFSTAGGAAGAVAAIGQVGQGLRTVVGFAGDAASGLFNFGQAVLEAQSGLERLRLGFATLSNNNLSVAGAQIDYVRKVSQDLGVEFGTTAKAFLQLTASSRGTSLEGARTRDIFEAVTLASRNLGLSTYQTENAFRALQQMVSKGVVQQEELRGQLSEALPGATQIAARALGITTDQMGKLIEKGELFANDFIPKFAAQLRKELGSELGDGVNRSILAVNNLNSSFEQAKQAFSDAGPANAAAGQFNILSDALTGFSERMRKAKEENAGFFGTLAAGFGSILRFLNPLNAFSYSAQSAAGILKQQKEELVGLKAEIDKIDPEKVSAGLGVRRGLESRRAALQARIDVLQAAVDAAGAGPRGEAADVRKADRAAEVAHAENMARLLGALQSRYKDLNLERTTELAQLEQLKEAGKFVGDPKEYDRLREAIIKKTTVLTDDDRANARNEKTLAAFVVRLKEEIKAFQDLNADHEQSKKQAREEAELTTLSSNAHTKKAKALAEEAKILLEQRNDAELRLQQSNSDKKAEEAYTKAIDDRIKKLNEQAQADEFQADVYGTQREKAAALAEQKLRLAAIEAERLLISKRDRGAGEAEIAQLEELVASYKRAVAAKDSLQARAPDQLGQLIRDLEKKDAEATTKRLNDLREGLISRFKSSKDIGQALVSTLQDELERKAFKVLIEPLTDPLIKALDAVIQAFGDSLSKAAANSFNNKDATASSSGGSSSGFISGIASFFSDWFSGFTFADGGVMTDRGPVTLKKYATGGIARGPQLVMRGEGGLPEAYVPLPDGRSIPVTVQGGGQGAIYVNVYNTGGEARVARTESKQTNRGTEISLFLEQMTGAMAADIKKGRGLAPIIETQYGLNRAAGAVR